jgi:hypothetical protein
MPREFWRGLGFGLSASAVFWTALLLFAWKVL